LEFLAHSCFLSDLEKLNLRAVLWRLYLGNIPENNNFCEWVDCIEKSRRIYKEKSAKLNQSKKISGDPLGGLNQSDVMES
jgi:hypothetical protein